MKHGPNALIDEELPVVLIATREENNAASQICYEKTLSNIKEVKARGGIVTGGDRDARECVDHALEVPTISELLAPILEIVLMLAYHIAVSSGCDVDQTRNLAKSVTVE